MNRRSFFRSLGQIAATLAIAPKVLLERPWYAKPLTIRNIPAAAPAVVARKIYRSNGNGAFHLIATINDNTTRSWTDAPETGSYRYEVVDQLDGGYQALPSLANPDPIHAIQGDTVTLTFLEAKHAAVP